MEVVGEEPNHTTAKKPGPLPIIQYLSFQWDECKWQVPKRSRFQDIYSFEDYIIFDYLLALYCESVKKI
jgi:hypothetical protein